MFNLALAAFKEVNSCMDVGENNNEHNSSDRSAEPEIADPEENTVDRESSDAGRFADIQPPPIAKTKGSGGKKGKAGVQPASKKASKPARPEPELDEHGKPKGQRLCGNCNTIAGHNARTCKRREMAAKLYENHLKVYGSSTPPEIVKNSIKKFLATQDIAGEHEEELLDTDEDEDSEDNTEEEIDMAEDGDDEEVEADDDEEVEVDEDRSIRNAGGRMSSPVVKIQNADLVAGRRTCSICKERSGHNAKTCPNKDKILWQQLAERQANTGAGRKMMPKGVRTCHSCGTISGHNSRTCMKLQIEKQLQQEQMKLQSTPAGTKPSVQKEKAKNVAEVEPAEGPRRSSRLKD